MKKRHLVILLIVIAVFSCNSHEKKANEKNVNKLVGTWRLIEYTDFDSINNKWKFRRVWLFWNLYN